MKSRIIRQLHAPAFYATKGTPVDVLVNRGLSPTGGRLISVGNEEARPSRGGLFIVLIDECHLQ